MVMMIAGGGINCQHIQRRDLTLPPGQPVVWLIGGAKSGASTYLCQLYKKSPHLTAIIPVTRMNWPEIENRLTNGPTKLVLVELIGQFDPGELRDMHHYCELVAMACQACVIISYYLPPLEVESIVWMPTLTNAELECLCKVKMPNVVATRLVAQTVSKLTGGHPYLADLLIRKVAQAGPVSAQLIKQCWTALCKEHPFVIRLGRLVRELAATLKGISQTPVGQLLCDAHDDPDVVKVFSEGLVWGPPDAKNHLKVLSASLPVPALSLYDPWVWTLKQGWHRVNREKARNLMSAAPLYIDLSRGIYIKGQAQALFDNDSDQARLLRYLALVHAGGAADVRREDVVKELYGPRVTQSSKDHFRRVLLYKTRRALLPCKQRILIADRNAVRLDMRHVVILGPPGVSPPCLAQISTPSSPGQGLSRHQP